MTKIISLSEDDVIVLKELLDRVRKQPVNPGGKTPPAETLALPTQFVAKAPSAGIAGRVGSQIFNADCTIYRRISEELIDAGFTRTVWNTALGAVPGDGVVAVWLDSWGTWWTAGVPASDDVETVGTGSAVTTPTITTDPATDTATGPAFVFTGVGVTIDAAGNEVTFDVDDVTIDTDPVTDTATAPFVFKGLGDIEISASGNEVTFTDYPGTGTPTTIQTDPATGVATGYDFTFEGVGVGITATAPNRVTFTVPDPAAPACGEVKIQETELVCEDRPGSGTGLGDGDLNLYRRNVYLSIVDGCLELVRGPWLFQNTVACCNPTCYTGGIGTGTGTGTGGDVLWYCVTIGTCADAILLDWPGTKAGGNADGNEIWYKVSPATTSEIYFAKTVTGTISIEIYEGTTCEDKTLVATLTDQCTNLTPGDSGNSFWIRITGGGLFELAFDVGGCV